MGGLRRVSKGVVLGRERRVRRGSLVYVKALWRGWPVSLVSPTSWLER